MAVEKGLVWRWSLGPLKYKALLSTDRKKSNNGLLEKYASTYIFAKFPKYTNSLPFPIEVNTIGSKTPTNCIHFNANYNYGADYQLIKKNSDGSLHNTMCSPQNTFTIVQFDVCIT